MAGRASSGWSVVVVVVDAVLVFDDVVEVVVGVVGAVVVPSVCVTTDEVLDVE